ncbi:MAG: hypothetical protein IKG93_10070 [Clostridiales bacterium]|nr:hypothetical protein [Clostridiales bacterium]
MKKALSIILSAGVALLMIGCDSSSIKSKTNSSKKTTTITEKAEESTKKKDAKVENKETAAEYDSKSVEYTIADEVIVSNEQCTVTLVSGKDKKSGGAEFKFLLENKTSSKTLMFSIDDVAINGWMITALFAQEVSAEKKANETLSFNKSNFEDAGITSVDKLEFKLRIYDSNDWSAESVVDETFVVYPTGLSESQISIPDRWKGSNEKVIVDNDEVTFIVLGTYTDSIWGYSVAVYLENKTDKNLMFTWDESSINGFMVDAYWATTVSPGNRKIDSVQFSNSKIEENGIKEVNDIEFKLRIYDSDNWSADDVVKETFKYSVG